MDHDGQEIPQQRPGTARTILPYIAGVISAYIFEYLADQFRRKSYFLITPQTFFTIIHTVLTPLAPNIKGNVGDCYFAIALMSMGLNPIYPGSSSWFSSNLADSAKRTLGIAYMT
ncbi:hypothetical protein VUR80DRAFT_3845 [Thermomyces stellatus]